MNHVFPSPCPSCLFDIPDAKHRLLPFLLTELQRGATPKPPSAVGLDRFLKTKFEEKQTDIYIDYNGINFFPFKIFQRIEKKTCESRDQNLILKTTPRGQEGLAVTPASPRYCCQIADSISRPFLYKCVYENMLRT